MTSHLSGRTALVTGGAVRIGAHICEALADAGAGVVVHHRTSRQAADALVERLRSRGAPAWAVACDLADRTGVEGLVDRAAGAAGAPVDLLVNNASIFPRSTFASASWDGLQECIQVNAWAPFELMRRLASQLPEGNAGAVVNLLDTRLVDLDPHHFEYHLSKALLAEVTRAGARSLAPRVRVNGVAPGPILEPVGTGDGQYLERMAARMPLARTPEPEEVAAAVAHLLASPSVTGQVLHVDAGRHLGRPIPDA